VGEIMTAVRQYERGDPAALAALLTPDDAVRTIPGRAPVVDRGAAHRESGRRRRANLTPRRWRL
jgi:hypothetical protein